MILVDVSQTVTFLSISALHVEVIMSAFLIEVLSKQ